MRRFIPLLLVVGALPLSACGGDGSSTSTTRAGAPAGHRSGRVLEVPSRYPTIQRAVDATRPGDLVLVAPGTYHERVLVTDEHPRIVIRGIDRNRTVLDGKGSLASGITVRAGGVAVENLTVHSYRVNGVIWAADGGYMARGRQLDGWRGSYLTAYDNGLYGTYAFGAQNGRFDHVYASGQPDSGIYVGRCNPCHTVVRDSVMESNHVGFEATNASGDVVVARNVMRRNRVGVQLNSLSKEAAAPQRGLSVVANRIADNQNRQAPRGSAGFGAGVVINGGQGDVVARNRITGHSGVGVVVLDSPDFAQRANRVERNAFAGNRLDLALQAEAGSTAGTCFVDNAAPRTAPRDLEKRARCGAQVHMKAGTVDLPAPPPQVDYRRVPPPPAQPSMPRAATADAQPATGLPGPGETRALAGGQTR